MKNITLSGDEALIQKAREKARQENTTLNAVFREWLARYVGQNGGQEEYLSLMKRLSYVRPGRRFSREEMNAR
jgi:hypothetical protein